MTTIQKTKRKRTDKQRIGDRLDDLYRELIRKRAMMRAGGCERCGRAKSSYKDLDTAHCHGRGKHTVRWDERNGAGICGGCHLLIDAQITEKEALFRRLLGDEEYERLYILAEMTTKQSPIDYKVVEIYLKAKIKELEDDHNRHLALCEEILQRED
ncbi:MAG: hypothetical protein MUO61_03385 [Dehalococcoidia bacterium]|nr:hypothetical protein [Dehalococcoidia bacterium]